MVHTLFYIALAISTVILLIVGFLISRTTRRTRTQADEIRDDAFALVDEVNDVLSKDSVLAGLIRAGHGPRVNYGEAKDLPASCFIDRQQPEPKAKPSCLAVLRLSPQELDCVPQSLLFYVFFNS